MSPPYTRYTHHKTTPFLIHLDSKAHFLLRSQASQRTEAFTAFLMIVARLVIKAVIVPIIIASFVGTDNTFPRIFISLRL